MLCRVTLLRHGHAEEGPDDYARALSQVGRAAAIQAGKALGRAGWVPEHLLSSPAPRALATATLVAEACGYRGSIHADPALYLAADPLYLAALRSSPEGVRSVLLVAHNPGLTSLARELCGYTSELAPAEYVSASFELERWSELG